MKKIGVLIVLAGVMLVGFWPEEPTASELKLAALTERGEKGPKPEYPGEAAAWLAGVRETPNDANPAALNLDAMDVTRRAASKRGLSTLVNMTIEDYGPGNFGGRIRGMAIHPTMPDHMLVGGVSGGVWKTEDGGQSWRAINDFMTNLAVGCMQLDPDNANVVWIGTGEGFFNIDAARGLGIFKSEDFGETWTQVASTNNGDFSYVNRIARVPGTDILVAATRQGLFRSTNGGTSFTEVTGVNTSSRGFVDVKTDPSDDTRLYAVHYGSSNTTRYLMRSEDSGATWQQLGAAEGMPTSNVGRMEIGLGTDGVVYISVANSSSTTRGLWRSPAGGNAFAQTASATNYIPRQGWYDLMIGVDPTDSDRVYTGAVDVFRSTDAGGTIDQITTWSPNSGELPNHVHADIHNIAFHPNDPMTLFIVCDGGIYKSENGGDTFISLNNDLRLCQNYGIAVSPDGESVIGGTQDNGTHLFYGRPQDWLEWAGGDGGYCAWDQQDANYVYGSTPNGGLYGSNNGGMSTEGMSGLTGSFPFIQAFTLDPNNGQRMMVCGSSLHYTENARDLETAVFTDLGISSGTWTSATFSPHNASIAYVGSNGGDVYRTDNLGTTATFTDVTNNLPQGSDVTWITVDPFDTSSNTVYVTLADYGSDRVWKSTDGGASWTSISAGLPDIPTFSIVVDPTDAARLFLGTELGLWSTTGNADGVISWEHYDYGVAWTRVMQLHWGTDDVLYIGTHGRGTFRAERAATAITVSDFVELEECDGDKYLDDGESVSFAITVENTGGLDLDSVNVSVSVDQAQVGLSGAQSLGSIAPGNTAMGDFEAALVNMPACLTDATYTVTITHSGGTEVHTFTRTLGANGDVQTGTFVEDAESGDHLMTSVALLNVDDWSRVTTQASSGTSSWFAADIESYTDKSLMSPWLSVQNGNTVLSFDLYYDMEGDPSQYWDGTLLEMRTEGGEWFDIGHMSSVPYDGPLFNNNTAAGRDAWSGVQTSWRSATVSLGSTYNGQNIQFRFRVVCDTGAANAGGGFWVDNIEMSNVSWLQSLVCDTVTCQSCFGTPAEAIQAMLDSAGAGEWSNTRTILDYIDGLNSICPE